MNTRPLSDAIYVVLSFALVIPYAIVTSSCSPAMKQAEQRVLNVADVVCAIDALDPGLAPAEIDAVIQKACGASPDIHKIVDAQARSLSRASARAMLRPATSASACASAAPAGSR